MRNDQHLSDTRAPENFEHRHSTQATFEVGLSATWSASIEQINWEGALWQLDARRIAVDHLYESPLSSQWIVEMGSSFERIKHT